MKRVLASVSLSGPLPARLAAAAAAGFDGVEIAEGDLATSPLSARDIAARVHELGMTVEMYQPLRDIEGVAEADLGSALARMDRAFDLAGQLGTTRVQIASNVETAVSGDLPRTANQLRRVAERAAHHGMTVAWEPVGWARYLRLHAQGRDLVEAVDHPALGLCLDLFHFACGGEPAAVLRTIPASRIAFVQLNDKPRMDGDLLAISRVHRLLPGQGDADVDAYVAELIATGYDGPVSVEVFDERGRLGPPDRVAQVAATALDTVLRDAGRPPVPAIRGLVRVDLPAATIAVLAQVGIVSPALTSTDACRIGAITWSGAESARADELRELAPVPSDIADEAPDPAVLGLTLATDQLDEMTLYARRALGLQVERGAQVAGSRSPLRPLLGRDGDIVRLRIDHADAGVGPAVDGITLLVDNLTAVATLARDADLSQEVPAGYYDILSVRSALTEPEIRQLQQHRLTLDTTAAGPKRRLTLPTPGVIIELVDQPGSSAASEVDAATLRQVRAWLNQNSS
ncbi:MAG: sugar phosphate isomerase/epimerase family protein [Propioniciclava sp.]